MVFSANIADYIIVLNWTWWFLNLQYFSFISMPSVCKEDSIYKRGGEIIIFLFALQFLLTVTSPSLSNNLCWQKPAVIHGRMH